MKKLGFGLMRMPTIDKTNAADVDIEQVKKMVDLLMEKGFPQHLPIIKNLKTVSEHFDH